MLPELSVKKWLCRILCLGFLALGVHLCLSTGAPEVVWQHDCILRPENEGRYVIAEGRPGFSSRTKDTDLRVSAGAPVLRRLVSRDGARPHAGHPFNLEGRDFVSEITLGGTLVLDAGFTRRLLLGEEKQGGRDASGFPAPIGIWKDVSRLPAAAAPKGLACTGNAYAAPPGGPLFRIGYKVCFIPREACVHSVIGLQKDGRLVFEEGVSDIRPAGPGAVRAARLAVRRLRNGSRGFLAFLLLALPFFFLGWSRD